MNQYECDDIIDQENIQSDEKISNNMNTTPLASDCGPAIDSVMAELLKTGESEAPEAEQNCPEASQPESQSQTMQINSKSDDTETESAADVNNYIKKPDNVPQRVVQEFNPRLNRHHEQIIKAEPETEPTYHVNTGLPALEPPPLHPPLQSCHRNIPSNQANIATSCITGFQSTFSQEHMGLADPCKPACDIIHRHNSNPHYTEPRPSYNQCQNWPQQIQHCQHNQFINGNVNNNASPTNYHGFEKPSYGLVQQVMEVFKLSGKTEMQPSEVYYELEKQFPYYRYLDAQRRKSWASSVRHALTNPQFKARRCTDEDGKPANRRGNFWSIDENFVPGQENTPNRPQQPYRRRSKIMSPGGRCNYVKNHPSPGQLISEPLAGTSMMSPSIAYSNVAQSNGIPMMIPTSQFGGQTVQLVPSVNSGINVNQTFPKQSPVVASNGQFLWIPPANANPQQQQQQIQQHVQHNGTTWGNGQIATINPAAFSGSMTNNYNFSNNIQQMHQNQQLQQQHQQRQLLLQQQQQQQHRQQQHAMQNATVYQYAAAPIKQQTLHPQKYYTTGHRASVNVAGNIINVPITAASSHIPQQQQHSQQSQISTMIRTTDGQMTPSCSTVIQAFADIARSQQEGSMATQPDVGPGGDTTPTQPSIDGSETINTSQECQIAPVATESHEDIARQAEDIVRQAVESEIMNAMEDINNTECENQSSSDPQTRQPDNGLFPVTLYTSSNTPNPDDEKTVLPSIEAFTTSLTNQTCTAMAQASDTSLTENESAGNANVTLNVTVIPAVTNDKNTEEGRTDLRSMVFNEVCSPDEQHTPTVSTVPNPQVTTSTEPPHMISTAASEPCTTMLTNMDSVPMAQPSEQWNH